MAVKIVKEYYDLDNKGTTENKITTKNTLQKSVCKCYFDDATKAIYSVVIPRDKMSAVINRKYDQLDDSVLTDGLYYLVYRDRRGVITKLYVGETERDDESRKLSRMITHLDKKEGWTEAIVFFSSAENGGLKGIVKSLENYAIGEAFKSYYYFENGNQSKSDKCNKLIIEAIYNDIFIIMSSLGIDLSPVKSSEIFESTVKGVNARIVYSLSGDFLVLPESDIDMANLSDKKTENLRANDISSSHIIVEKCGKYCINKVKIPVFSSISQATKYVCGGNTRQGTTEWRNKKGVTIGDYYNLKSYKSKTM